MTAAPESPEPALAAVCGCMTEDPGDGGGERVVTHSGRCPLHPDYEPDATKVCPHRRCSTCKTCHWCGKDDPAPAAAILAATPTAARTEAD